MGANHKVTVVEAIARQWAQSKNPLLQQKFIEITYGKVPDRTELTGADGGPIDMRIAELLVKLDRQGDARIGGIIDKANELLGKGCLAPDSAGGADDTEASEAGELEAASGQERIQG